jgi:peptidyl-prolyl cis-trans isomerase SurA
MKTLALLLVVFASPLLAQRGAANPPPQYPLDRVVGVVGTKAILWSEVGEMVNQKRAQGATLPPDSAGQMAFARQVLSELIDEEVLVQRASADTSITVSDADLNETVEQQVKQLRSKIPNDQEFVAALKENGFGNQEEYRRWLLEQSRRRELQQRYIEKLKREGKMINVAVSDAEVNTAYERDKGKFPQRPPSVTFRQIVIATSASEKAKAVAKAKADSILALIKAGADFEQLAKRESMDSLSREVGGDLGWNRREALVPEFANVLFSVPPGQLGPVTQTQYGFHVIRVDRAKPTEVRGRHILIKPKYDSADVTRAHALADSVLRLWKSGVSYDSLYKKFHDRDELEGSLEPFPRDSLPPSYGKAFEGKSNNDFVDPFPIHDPQRGVPKFVLAQIIEARPAGEYTLAELRERIRQQLQQEKSFRRLLDTLRKETYVWINLEGASAIKAPGGTR